MVSPSGARTLCFQERHVLSCRRRGIDYSVLTRSGWFPSTASMCSANQLQCEVVVSHVLKAHEDLAIEVLSLPDGVGVRAGFKQHSLDALVFREASRLIAVRVPAAQWSMV
jgi:predicted LPLAT superfamily acyltransferase